MENQNIRNLLLAEYHRYQMNDLKTDIEVNLVSKPKLEKLQGWSLDKFDASVMVDVPVVETSSQWESYQKAIYFHRERHEFFKQQVPMGLKLRYIEIDNICNKFKFGTEPSFEELFTFFLTAEIKIAEIEVSK